jgi:hypothetical protein
MATPLRLIASSLGVTVTLAAAMAAQPPRIANGPVTTQAAGSPFVQAFRAMVSSEPDVAWIGYSVPVADRDHLMCCSNSGSNWISNGEVSSDGSSCCGACRLEPSSGASPAGNVASVRPDAGGVVKLEGSERMVVLYRVADKRVDRIRVFSEDCQLDAGGRPVRWLDNVRPADSVALLESFAVPDGDGKNRIMDRAVSAIALHGDPAADAALDRLVAPAQPEAVRRKVTFWLGNARGRHGFDTLRRMLRADPSVAVRKSAIFGLSQSKVPERIDTLVGVARSDAEPRLRSEALFWLAQQAGRQASEAITERIEQDPDTEVKKKAVFALSQLPKDEGVPLLIKVARTNSNPAVRTQAMFWLGQSKDPRAVDFFAEILK